MPNLVEESFFIGCAVVTNVESRKAACLLFEGFFETKECALDILRGVAESHYPARDGWAASLNMDESRIIPPRVVEKRDHSVGQITMDGVLGETFVFPERGNSNLN